MDRKDHFSGYEDWSAIVIGRKILYIISSYAPQSKLSESKKDNFFNLLGSISVVPSEEMLLVCGDLNAHVRKTSSGFKGIHGWYGYKSEIQRALEFSNSMLQQI